jgi:LPS sulfotransferase NodH
VNGPNAEGRALAAREDLFRNVVIDPQRQAKQLEKALASLRYVIHFTPRSGSSWLTDIIAATKRLSAASEAFNPNFIPGIAQSINATDLDSYVQMLQRVFNTRGVYGVEVTSHQIKAVFGDYAAFHAVFGNAPCFWLIRQDIVAQAVSLAKMITTKVGHTVGSDLKARQEADLAFSYDSAQIKQWLGHIRAAEVRSETWFSDYGLSPLRMSYEATTRLTPLQMVNVIARHIGVADIEPMTFLTQHSKLGTDQNASFARRFRDENADYLAEIEAQRAPMLAKLHPIDDMVADLG